MPDDAVVLDNHLAFLADDRGEVRRCAAGAGDWVRRTVVTLAGSPT